MNIWKNLIGHGINSRIMAGTKLITWIPLAMCPFCFAGSTFAADPPAQVTQHAPAAFAGEKTA